MAVKTRRSNNPAQACGKRNSPIRRPVRREKFRRRSCDPSRAEPGREPWDSVADVLNVLLESALPRHKSDYAMLEQHWPDIVGREIARHTRPGAVRGNTLIVFAANSAWLQELQARNTSATLLAAVRAVLPGTPIEKVRWRSDPGG